MTTSLTPADVLAHGRAVFAHHIKLATAATKVDLAASLAIDVIAAEALRAGGTLHALSTLAPEVARELNTAHGEAAAQMRNLREGLIDRIKPTTEAMAAAYQIDHAADAGPMWINQGGKHRAVSRPQNSDEWRYIGALVLGGDKTAEAASAAVYRTTRFTSSETESRQAEALIQLAMQELVDRIDRFGLREDVLQALQTHAPTSGSAAPAPAPEQASPQTV